MQKVMKRIQITWLCFKWMDTTNIISVNKILHSKHLRWREHFRHWFNYVKVYIFFFFSLVYFTNVTMNDEWMFLSVKTELWSSFISEWMISADLCTSGGSLTSVSIQNSIQKSSLLHLGYMNSCLETLSYRILRLWWKSCSVLLSDHQTQFSTLDDIHLTCVGREFDIKVTCDMGWRRAALPL